MQIPFATADSLKVGGTGTATELLRILGTAFTHQSGVTVEVVPSLGSSGAIRAAADGVLDVAVSGRALKRDEIGNGLSIALTARTPFVFATSHPAPNALRSARIAEVYSTIKATWSDGSALRIILRPRSESDTALMGELFPGLAAALEAARQRSDVPVAATDQDNADLAEETPGSLIGSTLAQIVTEKRRLRPIALDGVEPTIENFESGAYPYAKALHFVVGATANPLVKHFVAFLRSPEGQKALRQASTRL
jgi:phosphate transport system substrate-binding protein